MVGATSPALDRHLNFYRGRLLGRNLPKYEIGYACGGDRKRSLIDASLAHVQALPGEEKLNDDCGAVFVGRVERQLSGRGTEGTAGEIDGMRAPSLARHTLESNAPRVLHRLFCDERAVRAPHRQERTADHGDQQHQDARIDKKLDEGKSPLTTFTPYHFSCGHTCASRS